MKQYIHIPLEMRSYLDSLIEDAGIKTVDDEMREDFIQQLFIRLDNYIASVIVNNLPQEQLEPFVKLNEENRSKEEIEAFLLTHLPNSRQVFSQAFVDFREMYLNNVEQARNSQRANADTKNE